MGEDSHLDNGHYHPDLLLSFEEILKEETLKNDVETKKEIEARRLTLFTKQILNCKVVPQRERLEDLVRFCTITEDQKAMKKRDTRMNLKPTLVRDSSLSLVELPTFLCPDVTLGTVFDYSSVIDPVLVLEEKLARVKVRRLKSKMGKKSQWTVMCVALGFFTSCLFIVGGMLSITSEYQDRAIARRLNLTMHNFS